MPEAAEEPKTAADAVTAALAELAPPPETDVETPPEEEVVETPAPEGDAPEGEVVETDEEKAAEQAAGDEGGEETDEEKAAREAAEKEAAANAGKTPEQIAAEKVAKEKPMDAVNDPIPANMHERTKERITSLVSMVKELQPIKAQHEDLITRITSTGMGADEFAMQLTYSRLIHSDNIDDKRQGYQILLNELRALAPLIGEVLPGMDPLEGHTDLIAEVTAKTLTPERAAEIARGRNQKAAEGKLQTQTRAVRETQAQLTEATKTAVAELNALGQQLSKTDPQFAAKYALIVPIMKRTLPKIHPSQWKATFTEAWGDLKVAAPARVTPKPTGNQPLRANKQPAGGGVKQPTTMLEAVTAAIAKK